MTSGEQLGIFLTISRQLFKLTSALKEVDCPDGFINSIFKLVVSGDRTLGFRIQREAFPHR